MNISAPFIQRPVATTILMVALVLFGYFAYKALPVSELPNVDYPTIVVTASLPGADPETMASSVTTPLEKQLSAASSLDSMSSVSTAGQTRITMQFALSRNIDAAAQDVEIALSRANKSLPPEMTTPPTFRKSNPADAPILYLAFTADHLPLSTLDDYAETYIAQRLSMISGVAEVNVFGSQQYAVRIYLNPNALATRGLDVDNVSNAIQQLNTNQPSGILQMDAHYHTIKIDGQLTKASAYNKAVIAYQNNTPIYLKDVGYAFDSIANDKAGAWYGNQKAIILAIKRQPDANTVNVIQNIYKILPSLTRDLPGGAKLNVVYDRSQYIKTTIFDMEITLLFAALLVALVIYLFLDNLAATVITALALPISVIGTFALMYLLHLNIDTLSLLALILAVGFVIDDAVVMVENIIRYFEQGMDRLSAALKGSKQVCFTIVSMTVSLVAVFIPILFMGGLVGRLFKEFAIVVSLAILLSGVISLTFTPMLSGRMLAKNTPRQRKHHRFVAWFERCKQSYGTSLNWFIDHKRWVYLPAGLVLIATALLFIYVPKGFIPPEDTGLLRGVTQAPEGVTYPDFVASQLQAAKVIQHNPNVHGLISIVGQGAGAVTSSTTGMFTIGLKPSYDRLDSADTVLQQLRKQLKSILGLKVYLQNPPIIRIGGMVARSNYQYVLQGMDWDNLIATAAKFQPLLEKVNGITDVNSDLEINNPEIHLHILRDQAAALGITPAEIENALYTAYGESEISQIMTPMNDYQVIIEVDPKYQQNINDLNSLYLHSSNGSMVPLLSLVNVQQSAGPLAVNHYNLLPSITFSFDLAPGTSLSSVTNQINHLARHYLPDDISGTFIGTAQTFESSLHTLPILLLVTILVIYMVLAILYEHFIHPLTILTALPFAIFGALLVLPLFGQELDVYSFIGLIMLVGIVKKNGIMMVDFALEAQRENKLTPREAIYQACLIRFRPIMMTTVAALLAALPIALGFGASGEAHRSLGIAMVGGLIFSQLLTLYVTPVFYLTMESLTQRLKTSELIEQNESD